MAKIVIDESMLLEAVSSGDGTMSWVLDRATGELYPTESDWLSLDYDEADDEEDDDEDGGEGEAAEDAASGGASGEADAEPIGDDDDLRRAMKRDPKRFVWVDSMDSHEGFRLMEDFVDEQADRRVREALLDALDRRRPFRSFKDALMSFPEVREAWFKYEQRRQREYALDWLESRGIEAELRDVPPPAPA